MGETALPADLRTAACPHAWVVGSRDENGHDVRCKKRWPLARKQATSVIVSPLRWVALIAAGAMFANAVMLWLLEGASPGAYALGEVLGTHIVAFLITALVASITRVGSIGTMVAVYLLAFAAIQVLLVLTDLT